MTRRSRVVRPVVLDCSALPDGVEPYTDLANAHRFFALRGADLRHTRAHGWLAWDGARWTVDATGAAHRAAQATVTELARYAGTMLAKLPRRESDGGEADQRGQRQRRAAEAYLGWARKSQDARRMAAILTVASSLDGIAVDATAFDRDRFALNVINGTLDLCTGELRPHRREDLITKLAPVAYDADATAPRWDAFLARMLPDPEVRDYMQRWIGYCLTGSVTEQKLVVCHGPSGDNGKSTLQGAVLAMLGDYAATAAPDLLLEKRHQSHPTEQADLHGRRLMTVSEIGRGGSWAVATMKRLTGGDPVKARYMGRDFFEFAPTHKFMLSCNARPRVKGADHATWRRIVLVSWDVRIPAAAKDPGLPAKLAAELPGILAWAVRGGLAWQESGLRAPRAVQVATDAYRDESDDVGRWWAACTSRDRDGVAESTTLYESYRRWAESEGARDLDIKAFVAEMKRRAAEFTVAPTKHARTRRAAWRGVALTETATGAAVDAHERALQ